MTINIGIIGASNIAGKIIRAGTLHGKNYRFAAVAARSLEKAEAFAEAHGIKKAYGSYTNLLADTDLDAVYITLPNHLHVPASLEAMEAGKHVIVEKPISTTRAELAPLMEATNRHPNLKVMEAFMYRFHPQWTAIKTLLAEGRIGTLRSVDAHFSYLNTDIGNIRNAYPLDEGGGALYDIGCYGISVARFLFGEDPIAVSGTMQIDPDLGVDTLTVATLEFPSGLSSFTCSSRAFRHQHVRIVGTEGIIDVPWPFNPDAATESRFTITHAEGVEDIIMPPADHYRLQFEAFATSIEESGPVPISLSDSAANLQVIEEIIAAE